MIRRQTQVIRGPLVHEGESAGRRRVPRVRWNHIESGFCNRKASSESFITSILGSSAQAVARAKNEMNERGKIHSNAHD